MADAIIEELWRVKDRMACEAGCDVKALAAAIRGAPDQRSARSGGPSQSRRAQEKSAADGAVSD